MSGGTEAPRSGGTPAAAPRTFRCDRVALYAFSGTLSWWRVAFAMVADLCYRIAGARREFVPHLEQP